MEAKVRIEAYTFTQFGSVVGILRAIGDDNLPADNWFPYSRFPAYVSLNRQYVERNGSKYFLRSGQSVSVNLLVRRKPLISLLTDALEKTLDSLRLIKSEQN